VKGLVAVEMFARLSLYYVMQRRLKASGLCFCFLHQLTGVNLAPGLKGSNRFTSVRWALPVNNSFIFVAHRHNLLELPLWVGDTH